MSQPASGAQLGSQLSLISPARPQARRPARSWRLVSAETAFAAKWRFRASATKASSTTTTTRTRVCTFRTPLQTDMAPKMGSQTQDSAFVKRCCQLRIDLISLTSNRVGWSKNSPDICCLPLNHSLLTFPAPPQKKIRGAFSRGKSVASFHSIIHGTMFRSRAEVPSTNRSRPEEREHSHGTKGWQTLQPTPKDVASSQPRRRCSAKKVACGLRSSQLISPLGGVNPVASGLFVANRFRTKHPSTSRPPADVGNKDTVLFWDKFKGHTL